MNRKVLSVFAAFVCCALATVAAVAGATDKEDSVGQPVVYRGELVGGWARADSRSGRYTTTAEASTATAATSTTLALPLSTTTTLPAPDKPFGRALLGDCMRDDGSGDPTALLFPLDMTYDLVDFFGDGASGSRPAQDTDQNNDDDSAITPIDFEFEFCGITSSELHVNNNGNVTLNDNFSPFTPTGFPIPTSISKLGMIAPFWGDVDTGKPDCQIGEVFFSTFDSEGGSDPNTIVVTWDRVGYFDRNIDKTNTFQVALSDGSNTFMGLGNTMCFAYDNVDWTSGDSSGGTAGLDGAPANVGGNFGDGVGFFQVGEFDRAGTSYDGPFGMNDGVDFLDGRAFCFRGCNPDGNVPPIPLFFPPNPPGIPNNPGCSPTVDTSFDEVVDMDLDFISPEEDQITDVVLADDDGTEGRGLTFGNTPGNPTPSTVDWAPTIADVGSYELILTATDDFQPVPGVTSVTCTITVVTSCGNGTPEGNEECDDGNRVSGDGCDANCIEEFCGDGITNDTDEECDLGLGNNSDTAPDTCRTNCRLPSCGDGVVDSSNNEACDDGNTADDDACLSSQTTTASSCRAATCGDGATCSDASCTTGPGGGPEQCDDGNTADGDACPSSSTSDATSCAVATCGDGLTCTDASCTTGPGGGPEQCDDGNTADGDTCLSSSSSDATSCVNASCGDGFTCADASCTTGPGGGPEQCDDGNTADDDACPSSSSSDVTSCSVASCGDGLTCSDASCTSGSGGGPEACDDGNTSDADACLTSSSSDATTCVEAACGDGFTCTDVSCTTGANGGAEACDDADTADDDACLSSSSSEETSCVVATCGDGVQCTDASCTSGAGDGPEACDDGNTDDSDSCLSSSSSEATSCVDAFCGDGFLCSDAGCATGSLMTVETCDDGNANNADACPDGSGGTCQDAVCADGFVEVCTDWGTTLALVGDEAVGDEVGDTRVSVATDRRGVWIATWEVAAVGSDVDLAYSVSTDNGATWSAPAPLNGNASEDSADDQRPHIATDGLGTWIVVWDTDEDTDGAGSDRDVFYAVSTDNGSTWSQPSALNSNAGGADVFDRFPFLVTDGAGTWVAAWGTEQFGGDRDLAYAVSSDDGATWSAAAPLNTNADTDSGPDGAVSIAADATGRFVAVWMSKDTLGDTIGDDRDILVTVSKNPLSGWSAPAPLNANAAGATVEDAFPSVATDGAGLWVAAWRSRNDLGGTIGSDNDVLAAASDDFGATWTAPAPVNSNAAGDAGSEGAVEVLGDRFGVFRAVFQTETAGGPTDKDVGSSFAAPSGVGDVSWSPLVLVGDTAEADTADDVFPMPGTDGNGAWLVAWHSNLPELTSGAMIGDDADVLFARLACDEVCEPGLDPDCRSDCTKPVCGDGIQDPGEECDDGNTDNTDRCLNGCVLAGCGDGFVCSAPDCETAPDGIEACDDGNTSNADACLSSGGSAATTCVVAACGDGFQCTDASCDGAPDGVEACDDGNTSDADACLSSASDAATTCVVAACGDGFACTDASCTSGAGGGPEDCDDGNTSNADACLSSAESDATRCVDAACGDGFTCSDASCTSGRDGEPEECDDGNTSNADDCLTSGDSPDTTCEFASCGDGFVCTDAGCTTGPSGGPEQCDDGNTSNSDACLSSAMSDATSCVNAACGDGFLCSDAGCTTGEGGTPEGCDDGNGDNADACPDGPGGTCQSAACDDGFLQLCEDFGSVASFDMDQATGDSGDDGRVDLATDGRGVWLAVHESSEPAVGGGIGVDLDVLVSVSTDDGDTWGPLGPVNNDAATDGGEDSRPVVATDGLGTWIVAWQSDEDRGSGVDFDVFYAISTDNGATWSDPAVASAGSASPDRFPAIATDRAGDWVVAWVTETLSDRDLAYSQSQDNGATWSAPAALNSNAAGDSGDDGSVSIATDGVDWVAVWHSNDDLAAVVGTDRDIFTARTTDPAAGWGALDVVNSNAMAAMVRDDSPDVATDGAGTWLAVWSSEDSQADTIGTDSDILTAVSVDGGATWSDAAPIDGDARADGLPDEAPAVAIDRFGTVRVVWARETAPGDNDIVTAASGAGRTTAVSVVSVDAPFSAEDLFPAVATNGRGRWIAAWQSDLALFGADDDILRATLDCGEVCEPSLDPTCRQDCTAPICGDGIADSPDEQCDDGDTDNGDGCLNSCAVASCGDGFVCADAATCSTGAGGGVEACDDGNTSDSDGCLSSSSSDASSCVVATCGDGFVCTAPGGECETVAGFETEGCDDGNTSNSDSCPAHVPGDGTCQTAFCGDGFECTDEATCTSGADGGVEACEDGNTASGDGCDAVCVVEFCGDGVVNNSTEECDDGGTADGDCCDADCFYEDVGSPCLDDDLCNGAEACDGAGVCAAGTPLVCDDDLFCTGVESCDAAQGCQPGTPPDCEALTDCELPDCDAQCNAPFCDESLDQCTVVPANEGATCDDGGPCTVRATCQSGSCEVVEETVLSQSCRWIILAGAPGETVEVFTGINARSFGNDICGDTGDFGGKSFDPGTVVATAGTGVGMNFRDTVAVETDIITGGASLGSGPATTVPGTELDTVPGGQIIEKNDTMGNPTGTFIDTTGVHPLLTVCDADQDALASSATVLDGLPSTRDLGDFKVRVEEELTLDGFDPGLNVIDMNTLRVRERSTLTLEGEPEDVVIFRVADTIRVSDGSSIRLAGGLKPEHVLFYNQGTECFVGVQVDGQGSWFCPNAPELHVSRETIWIGTLLGATEEIFMGHEAKLTWAPFTGR